MADESLTTERPYALTDEQVQEFLDRGYIILRGAVDPAWADELRETVLRTDAANLRVRGDRAYDLGGVELDRPQTWPEERLCVETGGGRDIEEVAPRVWGAVLSLLGEDVEVTQRLVGGQFIFNGKTRRHREETFNHAKCDWHIDATSKHSRFTGRLDGLTLLILFSRVGPGGGGTLFSGESLDHLVHMFEDLPGGIDTSVPYWARPIIDKCDDVFEFTGEPGDVLISHPLALHASQPNFSGALRVIENPTIMITRELDYRPANPSPNPVELAVIQRLQRPDQPIVDIRRQIAQGIELLTERHPDYLLPGRQAWETRVSPQQRAFVHELDRALCSAWFATAARPISESSKDERVRLEAATALIVEVLASDATVGMSLPDSLEHDDFGTTGFARLMRGFVSEQAQNHALVSLVAQITDGAEWIEFEDGSTAIRVSTSAHGVVWLDATRRPHLFRVDDAGLVEPLPIERFVELLEGQPPGPSPVNLTTSRVLEGPRLSPTRPLTELLALAPEIDSPPRSSPVWNLYLGARGRMLMAQRELARETFEDIRKRLRHGNTTRDIAQLFEDRLRFTEPALAALA